MLFFNFIFFDSEKYLAKNTLCNSSHLLMELYGSLEIYIIEYPIKENGNALQQISSMSKSGHPILLIQTLLLYSDEHMGPLMVAQQTTL